ncbi:MAG: 5-(carboxyamino)imidazole ribonucleotide mutase [Taibaiella sp.]|nr:5-(carboxyamino)imidazole ribonucleotide mutase [Taibaiella sp.]
MSKPTVGIIMGSSSDAAVMKPAAEILESFGIQFEFTVVSAHRSPELMYEYATTALKRGLKIIIAGAGGAAHLPGMIAAITTIPVIGVPVKSANSLDGWDSLLSIVQMPNDIPVATVAVNGAHNAGLLAIQMLAIHDPKLMKKLAEMKKKNVEKVKKQQLNVFSNLTK